MIKIIRPHESKYYDQKLIVNTTSHGNPQERTLSPFYLKHTKHPNVNIENYWQYSKFYPCHGELKYKDTYISITPKDMSEETLQEVEITDSFKEWSKTGMMQTWANRYPMGKDTKPICSIIERLGHYYALNYIQARKIIYAPAYANAVRKTPMYALLQEKHNNQQDIILIDYDATDISRGWNYVLHDPYHKMGHATVIAAMLLGEYNPL